jgi:hypothetical protein
MGVCFTCLHSTYPIHATLPHTLHTHRSCIWIEQKRASHALTHTHRMHHTNTLYIRPPHSSLTSHLPTLQTYPTNDRTNTTFTIHAWLTSTLCILSHRIPHTNTTHAYNMHHVRSPCTHPTYASHPQTIQTYPNQTTHFARPTHASPQHAHNHISYASHARYQHSAYIQSKYHINVMLYTNTKTSLAVHPHTLHAHCTHA